MAGLLSGQNRFFTNSDRARWMRFDQRFLSLSEWKAALSDGSSTAFRVTYPAAHETIADYVTDANGEPGNLDTFLAEARLQARTNWREEFVGTNAAAHFRGNFGLFVP